LAFQDVAVKRIEGEEGAVIAAARNDFRVHAALGRVRIDVVEMVEIRRIGEVAEGRHAVALGVLRRGRTDEPAAGAGGGRACQHAQSETAGYAHFLTTAAAAWPPCLCPTTRRSGKPNCRISAASAAGRSDPSARYAPCRRSTAARRNNS